VTEDARILVVDDEPRNVRLLSAVLGANGHTVTSASSGREVLDRVRTDDPDLLLLDIHSVVALRASTMVGG
jgi:CheY-like chemotaxis protein